MSWRLFQCQSTSLSTRGAFFLYNWYVPLWIVCSLSLLLSSTTAWAQSGDHWEDKRRKQGDDYVNRERKRSEDSIDKGRNRSNDKPPPWKADKSNRPVPLDCAPGTGPNASGTECVLNWNCAKNEGLTPGGQCKCLDGYSRDPKTQQCTVFSMEAFRATRVRRRSPAEAARIERDYQARERWKKLSARRPADMDVLCREGQASCLQLGKKYEQKRQFDRALAHYEQGCMGGAPQMDACRRALEVHGAGHQSLVLRANYDDAKSACSSGTDSACAAAVLRIGWRRRVETKPERAFSGLFMSAHGVSVTDGDLIDAPYLGNFRMDAQRTEAEGLIGLAIAMNLEIGFGSRGGFGYQTNWHAGLTARSASAWLGATVGAGLSGLTGDRIPFAVQGGPQVIAGFAGDSFAVIASAGPNWVSGDRRQDGSDTAPFGDELQASVNIGLPQFGLGIGANYAELMGTRLFGLSLSMVQLDQP